MKTVWLQIAIRPRKRSPDTIVILQTAIHERKISVTFPTADDSQIVDMYLQRDEQAISCTSVKYGKRIRSLARHITEDECTADECENDTYMEAWNRIPPHEPRDYLYAFLVRIVRHIALNRCEKNNALKRKASLVSLSDELNDCIAAPDSTESVVDDMALKESLNSFLAGLEPEKRNIFMRRYWYTDEITEIAERFGYSESKIKSMLMRMREKLRKHFEKDGIGV